MRAVDVEPTGSWDIRNPDPGELFGEWIRVVGFTEAYGRAVPSGSNGPSRVDLIERFLTPPGIGAAPVSFTSVMPTSFMKGGPKSLGDAITICLAPVAQNLGVHVGSVYCAVVLDMFDRREAGCNRSDQCSYYRTMTGGYDYRTKTIDDFVLLQKHHQLNLSPAFQRQSVWAISDRRRLIESLLERQPVPSIFLYRRHGNGGRLVYDVIDGKQRLESILMFMGAGGFGAADRFEVDVFDSEGVGRKAMWTDLSNDEKRTLRATQLQVVEIEWGLAEVIDLFVRINSTGKRLTGAEKLNARWVHNSFLVVAKKLAEEFEPFFRSNKVFSPGQLTRMKHVEFVAELIASVHAGGPINKKQELSRLIAGGTISDERLAWAQRELRATFRRVETMFPNLRKLRIRNSTELYTLTLLVQRLTEEGYALGYRSRAEIAEQMLVNFCVGVDTVSDRIKAGRGATADQATYLDYLNTVRSDTDSQRSRRKRAQLLGELLGGIFEPKDRVRSFTPLQRRILWHSSADRRCSYSGCKVKLSWDDFTIDHIRPHSKGGATDLENAQLMCRSHNASKGAR